MTEQLPVKKAEIVGSSPKSESKSSLSRRELLQKAGWVVPAVVVVGLSRSARPEQIRLSLLN